MRRTLMLATAALLSMAACGGSGGSSDGGDQGDGDTPFVDNINAAVEAVEAERGAPQQYFEVTANRQLTNVFVAVEAGTAAVPYVYLDGELQAPGPVLEGASGQTFTAVDIAFGEGDVLAEVRAELPTVSIAALSVEGGALGDVRYVVSTVSSQGGALDITIGSSGTVLAVDPI